MQRMRAGLTGLAAIFLMVLIAAAGLKPARPNVTAGAPARPPSETLAVLGVAPGSSGDGGHQAPAAPAAPIPAPRVR
jgi:hypothetical protein